MSLKTQNVKETVLGYKAPKKAFDSANYDQKCPFTGGLAVKNETVVGVVVKKDIHHSATIQWERQFYVPKYERYQKRRSRLRVHNPPCFDAEVGQKVVAARTRPLSKSKNHVIIAILGEEDVPKVAKGSKKSSKSTKKSVAKKEEVAAKAETVTESKDSESSADLVEPKIAEKTEENESN